MKQLGLVAATARSVMTNGNGPARRALLESAFKMTAKMEEAVTLESRILVCLMETLLIQLKSSHIVIALFHITELIASLSSN